jgi:hypothetical protein
MRRCEWELTNLSHHIIRFESSEISVPIIGLDDLAAGQVATRWCATASRRRGESGTPAIAVLSEICRESDSQEDDFRDFGSWRAVLRPGEGSDTVCRIDNGVAASDDFHRAVDLCVTHGLVLRGGVVVHGAAFEIDGRGIMVLGDSGSGKSTVVAAALCRDARVVSDDLLLLGHRSTGEIGAESLRRELFFRTPGVSVVPQDLAKGLVPVTDSGEDRWRLTPEVEPARFMKSVIPQRLWLVAVDRRLRESRLASVDQAEALAWLVRGLSGVLLSEGFDRERIPILDLLAALVASCPAVKLRLGHDLLASPEQTVDRFLALGERD